MTFRTFIINQVMGLVCLLCVVGSVGAGQMSALPTPDEQVTVTGVVEEINREDLTVTILTDAGRLLSLSAAGRDVIASLHAGDRVQIQILVGDEEEADSSDAPPRPDAGHKTEI